MISLKIKCLRRLAELTDNYGSIIDFLVKERLMNEEDMKNFKKASMPSDFLYLHLKNLQDEGKLIALSYEWEVLPDERIRVTIGNTNEYKTFTYNTI